MEGLGHGLDTGDTCSVCNMDAPAQSPRQALCARNGGFSAFVAHKRCLAVERGLQKLNAIRVQQPAREKALA